MKNGLEIDEYENKYHYVNNKLHREDGPACEYANGDKSWYQNDELHREDGPAVEYANGDKYWYQNDKLHREDGPAVEYADGFKSWYYNDAKINCNSQEEFSRIIEKLLVFI